jgi:hypothetical protein
MDADVRSFLDILKLSDTNAITVASGTPGIALNVVSVS